WTVEAVGQSGVECAIGLGMADARSAVTQHRLRDIDDLPLLAHARRMSRNSIDLTSVENCVDAIEEPVAPGIESFVPGFRGGFGASLRKLPEFNVRAFFAASHLPGVQIGRAHV